MKKLFTTLTVVIAITLLISSCTEEEVKPIADSKVNGGGTSEAGF